MELKAITLMEEVSQVAMQTWEGQEDKNNNNNMESTDKDLEEIMVGTLEEEMI